MKAASARRILAPKASKGEPGKHDLELEEVTGRVSSAFIPVKGRCDVWMESGRKATVVKKVLTNAWLDLGMCLAIGICLAIIPSTDSSVVYAPIANDRVAAGPWFNFSVPQVAANVLERGSS